jgi:hypothetical protein
MLEGMQTKTDSPACVFSSLQVSPLEQLALEQSVAQLTLMRL